MNKNAAKTHLDEVIEAADPPVLKRATRLLGDAIVTNMRPHVVSRLAQARGLKPDTCIR